MIKSQQVGTRRFEAVAYLVECHSRITDHFVVFSKRLQLNKDISFVPAAEDSFDAHSVKSFK